MNPLRYTKYLLIALAVVVGTGIMSAKGETDKKFTIVIDAGHGGKDYGAMDNGVNEKDINLKVAQNLESLIKKNMKDARVVLTRNTDTFLSLQERADRANRAQGDIFISIHTNSVAKSSKNRSFVAGSSVYTLGLHKDNNNLEVARRENSVIEFEKNFEQTYSGFDPEKDESYIIFEMAQKKNLSQSIMLANDIEKELIKIGRQDRGVHQAGFWVLWATSMPAVLVELDFICNPGAAEYMSSSKGSKELAEAIYRAVEKYENSWQKDRKNAANVAFVENSGENTLLGASADDEPIALAYSENVAKAKTKTHKTPEKKKTTQNDGRRKRRNERSKKASERQSYEKDIHTVAAAGVSNSTVISSDEETQPAKTSDTKKKTKADKSKAWAEKQRIQEEKELEKQRIKEEKQREKQRQKEEKELEKQRKKQEKEAKKNAGKNKNAGTKSSKSEGHTGKVNKIVKVYRIQVLASKDLLDTTNPRFKGLTNIRVFKDGDYYKYYYGESTDEAEIEAMLKEVKRKIPDAFIVDKQKTGKTNN